ncbi:MAG TPA: glycoside hydrolase family 43 protein [Allosphingosinicella sp.]|nr:glycoside hydrolase family 43 protein [Allosphingosinicella sp.]
MRSLFRSGRLALAGLAAAFAPSAIAAAAEPLFVPVFEQDFADPFVVLNNGEFTAYATNRGINLPMATSKDLIHWDYVRDSSGKLVDGMPELGRWARKDFTWAPEVMRVGTRWLLYYTARDRKRDIQCVGVAAADNPRGPFRDTSEAPLVCQPSEGGTIDADSFRDADGKLYLYYKSDGNAVGKGTVIWGQRLSADGMSVTGEPVAMVKDDKAWEWKLVEAPAMVRSPAGHRLFYSAAYYGWNPDQRLSPYATGYATCAGALGPCQDAPENPILHSFNDKKAGCLSGPGHPSIFQVGQRSFIAFHAWAATKGCRKAVDKRYLYVAPLMWEKGKPVIGLSLRPPKAKN